MLIPIEFAVMTRNREFGQLLHPPELQVQPFGHKLQVVVSES